jgi:hypothetical protein
MPGMLLQNIAPYLPDSGFPLNDPEWLEKSLRFIKNIRDLEIKMDNHFFSSPLSIEGII